MTYYMYNAYLRYSGVTDSRDECDPMCACTSEEPPPQPWPDGEWPYYLDDGWELVKVRQINGPPL